MSRVLQALLLTDHPLASEMAVSGNLALSRQADHSAFGTS